MKGRAEQLKTAVNTGYDFIVWFLWSRCCQALLSTPSIATEKSGHNGCSDTRFGKYQTKSGTV